MMTDTMHPLLESVTQTTKGRMALQRQGLFIDAVQMLYDLMTSNDISQAELARRLGKKRSQVSRWLSGQENMTLASLSDMLFVLGYAPRLEALPQTSQWDVVVDTTDVSTQQTIAVLPTSFPAVVAEWSKAAKPVARTVVEPQELKMMAA